MDTSWFTISNAAEVASPALLVSPGRVEENIRRMIRMAAGAERLRPHIKTNKLPEVIRMQMDQVESTRFNACVAGCYRCWLSMSATSLAS